MTDDPRRKHPAFESSTPPPAPEPMKLRPPRGSAFTRDEIPTKPRFAAPLPPIPERQPITVSEAAELRDAACEDERTGNYDGPKLVKGALIGVQLIPRKERASVVRTALLVLLGVAVTAGALLAYSIHLGHVPEFLR